MVFRRNVSDSNFCRSSSGLFRLKRPLFPAFGSIAFLLGSYKVTNSRPVRYDNCHLLSLGAKSTEIMKDRVLIIGASGQIGTELTFALREIYGEDHVIASDLKPNPMHRDKGRFIQLDALDRKALYELVHREKITQIYLLAAMLSATAEQHVEAAWKLNMDSLFNVLELAKENNAIRVYWPSSIAAFGPNTPKTDVPQFTVMDPSTVYGISKLSGELWCDYYNRRWGVDVRSLRYPGIISWKSEPGGGTTDYAIHIYREALRAGSYTSFLASDTRLPMMYMDDALRATIGIMEAPADQIKIRTSYNVAAISFTPAEVALSIQERMPNFTISYEPDFRQEIASGWPASINDGPARRDWGWNHQFDLNAITDDMLKNLS